MAVCSKIETPGANPDTSFSSLPPYPNNYQVQWFFFTVVLSYLSASVISQIIITIASWCFQKHLPKTWIGLWASPPWKPLLTSRERRMISPGRHRPSSLSPLPPFQLESPDQRALTKVSGRLRSPWTTEVMCKMPGICMFSRAIASRFQKSITWIRVKNSRFSRGIPSHTWLYSSHT